MSPTPLVSFSYLSTASYKLSSAQLQQLLARSRRWNREHGLTGILLYNDGSFMQLLEGPAEEVRRTFEQRIRRAGQHRDIIELFQMPCRKRSFPNWSMECKHHAGMQLPQVLELSEVRERHAALLQFWRMWEDPKLVA